MTEPLTIDDLTYIPIRDAAVSSRLSTEYLARLARQHRLRARIVARMWFFETNSLQQFLSTRTVDYVVTKQTGQPKPRAPLNSAVASPASPQNPRPPRLPISATHPSKIHGLHWSIWNLSKAKGLRRSERQFHEGKFATFSPGLGEG